MNGQVFVVTGGGGALAGSVARVFHAAGARLVLVDGRAEPLLTRARGLGALPIVADLGQWREAERVVGETLQAFGRLDGLVHTVGAFATAPAAANDEALYRRLLDANLGTTVAMVQACLPHFLGRRQGFIAAVASQVAWQGGAAPGMSLYAAAKAALAAFLRSVEREVAGAGVRVAIVYPMAAIDTEANRAAMPEADPGGWVDPEEIAQALLFAAGRSHRGVLLALPVGVVAAAGEDGGGR